MKRSPFVLHFVLTLAVLALAACGKKGAEPAATSPAASAPPAAASPTAPAVPATLDAATAALNAAEPPLPSLGDFKIVSVLIGNGVDEEHLVVTDTRQLAAKLPIYASVLSIGAHQGLKLSADWVAPDGHSFAKSDQPIVPNSDLATTFKVQNPGAWPVGDYQLHIAIDGHTVRTEAFSVR
jgi:predicted small lipoprotein YifL